MFPDQKSQFCYIMEWILLVNLTAIWYIVFFQSGIVNINLVYSVAFWFIVPSGNPAPKFFRQSFDAVDTVCTAKARFKTLPT
jgi:hypothetical protein